MFSGLGGRSLPTWQQVEARALVAPGAGGHLYKIVSVEGTLAIMALIAIIRRRDPVLLSGNIRHLPPLLSLSNVMTLVTALAGMGRVRENCLEHVSRLWRAAIRCDDVANTALADLAFSGVAAEAVIVRLKSDRNMPPSSCEIMACSTSLCRPRLASIMHSMVELHIEALHELCRKSLDLVRIASHILVADAAHRLCLGARELTQVATDAGLVAGKVHLERLALTAVA